MDRESFKKQAKTLRAQSAARGHLMTTAKSLETLAHSYGFRDWNTASVMLDKGPEPSTTPLDQRAARKSGDVQEDQVLNTTTSERGSRRFFSRLPIVRSLHPINRHSFSDLELARTLDQHLEAVLSDLSEVRSWLSPLKEDPTPGDLIAALHDTEGDGWLACMTTRIMGEGRWMLLPFGQSVDVFAAHEEALAAADGEGELRVPQAISRKVLIAHLRYTETNGVRPLKVTLSDPGARLSVLKARHAACTGFPYDLPASSDPYEVQEARQLDRLETVSLISRLKTTS